MSLPFDNISIFLYTFYGLIAVTIISMRSINIAVSEFKKGTEGV